MADATQKRLRIMHEACISIPHRMTELAVAGCGATSDVAVHTPLGQQAELRSLQ